MTVNGGKFVPLQQCPISPRLHPSGHDQDNVRAERKTQVFQLA